MAKATTATTKSAPKVAIIAKIDIEGRKALDMRVGDTVKVYQKIQEKGKTRLQVFEGMVLARKHGTEMGGTFTVRKTAGGYGVERIFPIFSPMIDKIEVTRRAKVRRSKLYYIRDKAAKEISKRMKMEMMRNDEAPSVVVPETSEAETVEVK